MFLFGVIWQRVFHAAEKGRTARVKSANICVGMYPAPEDRAWMVGFV
jgi:hypothetical protein